MSATPALLTIDDLRVHFATADGEVTAVAGVSLELRAGECLAIVGESGSGKTQTLLACLGLLAGNARATGSVRFEGRELLGARARAAVEAVRGTGIALLSQDPMNALTPHLRIGEQLPELLLDRHLATRTEARALAICALRDVEIPEPEARLRQYPHELSGGMRQRVALAMSLMGRPRLLLADEPTTALDVSVQARILRLLAGVRDKGLGVLLVTHDLGVVAGVADRVAVMYAGRIVEQGPASSVLATPRHPYTMALLAAVPRLDGDPHLRLPSIEGQPPRPGESRAGCDFAPRCTRADARCLEAAPVWGAGVACHRPVSP